MNERDTKSMRVVLLHNFLSPYRVPLFEALAERFDLVVWILGDVRSVRNWPADAPGAKFRMHAIPRITLPLGSRYNAIVLNHTLPRELARMKPDVIVCCGWDTPAAFYASWYAKRTQTPFVLWSGSTAAESTLLRRMTKPFVQTLVKRAQAWLAYGTRAKEYLVSLGADGKRTFLAFNTVELAVFEKACAETDRNALRERLGISTRYVAVYCGNLLDLKGVGDLIDAFARVCASKNTSATREGEWVDDITLVLVGSGKHEAKYRAMLRDAGIEARVKFAGFVPRTEVASYYAIADVLVLPSRSEVWGLVINEALACGVPVIASDACGATADLLRDGENGFIVPSRNPAALADALIKFFSHPERHNAMREAALGSIAPFTIDRAADAFVDAVRCALDRG